MFIHTIRWKCKDFFQIRRNFMLLYQARLSKKQPHANAAVIIFVAGAAIFVGNIVRYNIYAAVGAGKISIATLIRSHAALPVLLYA